MPPVPGRDELLSFVLEHCDERILVFEAGESVVYRNDRAERFLRRHALPAEIHALVERVFASIALGKTAEMFPGQICLRKEINGRIWFFRVVFRALSRAQVVVYFTDAAVSGRCDLNALRGRHGLTRRETDVLRHLLDGLKNLEIAEELAITEQTVKDHVSSIYLKVGVPDRFTLLRRLVSTTQA